MRAPDTNKPSSKSTSRAVITPAPIERSGEMADLEQIAESLSSLTVMEAAGLVKVLEEKWGVSAAAPVAVAAAAPAAAAEEEQTEFEVILTEVGPKKINVIKAVRQATSLGLKEAKEVVDGAPKTIKDGCTKDEAAKIKKIFEAEGAKVEVK